MTTTIKIREATKLQLDRLRSHPRESYDEIISKVAHLIKIDNHKLSKKAIEAIEMSREQVRKGHFYTEAEVRRRLGL
ncbi:MAG TPA: hypothetical protein VLJ21_03655 [Candidatus Binatia bacterium]|nr:hypothetical protein [Candidatus Binatia bacterium]